MANSDERSAVVAHYGGQELFRVEELLKKGM